MNVCRYDLQEKFNQIKDAIIQCDFVSVDTELSGLHVGEETKAIEVDTPEMRYQKYRCMASTYSIVQFGLTTFKFVPNKTNESHQTLTNGQGNEKPKGKCGPLTHVGYYQAEPYNFYLFPTATVGKAQRDQQLVCQNSAFDFLAKSGFDFNKWVYHGIPYMTRQQQKVYAASMLDRIQGNIPTIEVDEETRPFYRSFVKKLNEWLSNKRSNYMDVSTSNGYQNRLVHQEVRERNLNVITEGRRYSVRLIRASPAKAQEAQDKKMADFQQDVEEAMGFTRVLECLIQARKPIVGHNVLLDLCHIYHQFCDPLPTTLARFKTAIHGRFPVVFDTKFIAESASWWESPGMSTALEDMIDTLGDNIELLKNFKLGADFLSYGKPAFHEAGYDAFVTGKVFIWLWQLLGQHEAQIPPSNNVRVDFTSTDLQRRANRLHLVRSDIPFLNLAANDDAHGPKPNVYHIQTDQPCLVTDDYSRAFHKAPFGRCFIIPNGTRGVFLRLANIPPVVFQTTDTIEYLLQAYCDEKYQNQPWQGTIDAFDDIAQSLGEIVL
ncbi:hypothetical protein IWQ61_010258 [Dispira simplex]|nr:hypothetical protein IWQ61_010258 [Dispira simplex]